MTPLNESDIPRLALGLDLSPGMARLLIEVYNRAILTYAEISEMGLSQGHRVMVGRMRPILEKHGIQIETKHGIGYWMDAVSREAVRAALEGTKSSTPEE